jgi:metal-sulfur cluster biosynthetic enzyme
MVRKEDILAKLRKVIDPELGINIVDLGLVYDVSIKNGEVVILMTLTTPYCPVAGIFEQLVEDAVLEIEEVRGVSVKLTFDPPWMPELMSEEVKVKLGFG